MTSGATPACSAANSAPVRPNPVAISSKMSSTPWSSHASRSTRRYAGEWKDIPPAPCTTGSTITAASSSACRAISSRSCAAYASSGAASKPAGGASAKIWRGSTPCHSSCIPPSGSQTDIGCQVSPW